MSMRSAGPDVLNRYLMKEMLGTHLAVTVVLLLIIVGGVVARMLREAAEGRIPPDVLVPLVALGSVQGLILLLPVSLFLALMLGLGRLYKDSEMAALQACGVGPKRLYVAITWVTAPMVALLTVLVFWIAPLASATIDQVRIEAEGRSDLIGVAPGRFLESRVGGRVFFIEGYTADGNAMRDVFIQSRGPAGTEVVTARRAESRVDPVTGQRYLVLHDGHRYVGEPGEQAFRILDFELHGVRVPDPEGSRRVGKVDSRPTSTLLRSERLQERAELQWRISMPISMVLLAALALPLSHTNNPRQGRFGKLTAAIAVYIVYANFLILAKSWYAGGQTPAWLGMWWVHVALAGLIVLLLWRQRGLRVRRRARLREAGA
jgi:lipopolysaccharide export system permease protein